MYDQLIMHIYVRVRVCARV